MYFLERIDCEEIAVLIPPPPPLLYFLYTVILCPNKFFSTLRSYVVKNLKTKIFLENSFFRSTLTYVRYRLNAFVRRICKYGIRKYTRECTRRPCVHEINPASCFRTEN